MRDRFRISCFGVDIKKVSTVKYLGVHLDDNLSGNVQAMDVLKKASARLSFLYRKSNLLDFRSRVVLCMALIQPFFDYCSISWYTGINAKLKERFNAMQRKMVRFVYGFDSRYSVSIDHLRRLGWLSVNARVRYFKMITAFKIRMGKAPSYLTQSFTNISSVHSYNTRRSQTDYCVAPEDTASAAMLSSFTYTAKKDWNDLPASLKNIQKLEIFKSKLRKHLLDLC